MKIYLKDKDLPKLRKNQSLICSNCHHPIWIMGLHYGDRQTNECGYHNKKSGGCGCCDVDGVYIKTIKGKKVDKEVEK